MVKVMVSPTLGIGSLTILPTARSACCGDSVMPALLLPVFGSNWSLREMVARLVWAAVLETVAVIVNMAVTPLATAPTSHSPLPGAYVPWLGVAVAEVIAA